VNRKGIFDTVTHIEYVWLVPISSKVYTSTGACRPLFVSSTQTIPCRPVSNVVTHTTTNLCAVHDLCRPGLHAGKFWNRHRFQALPACDLIYLTSIVGSIYVESVWKRWRIYIFSPLVSWSSLPILQCTLHLPITPHWTLGTFGSCSKSDISIRPRPIGLLLFSVLISY